MQKINWNAGWAVQPGVPDPFGVLFGQAPKARPVTLPQDEMILEDRDPNCPSAGQTGFYPVKSYTYEKKFFAPADWQDRHSVLEFEGVMARAMVYLNGELIASNRYGYSQFYAELDRHLRFGEENTLRVLALGTERESRWYPGAGIYRDVVLWQSGRLSLVPEGVRLTTQRLEPGYAVVSARVSLSSTGLAARTVALKLSLLGPDGQEAASFTNKVSVLPQETVSSHGKLYVDAPALWSPDSPALYTWVATLTADGQELDRAQGTFGIRTLTADARGGLRLNGVETKLRGACIHHDNGILGATTLADAEEFRVRRLKAAGFNAIRSAHHPAGKALLDCCDRLGVLVMDEVSDMWDSPKNTGDYAVDFVNEWPQTLERLVAKDYNHPSVILYSLGNEIPDLGNRGGGRRNREMANTLRALDPTRLLTGGFNGFLAMADHMAEMAALMAPEQAAPADSGAEAAGSEALNAAMSKMSYERMDAFAASPALGEALEEPSCELDVVGYNYLTARHELEHTLHPERVIVGSETFPTEIGRLWPIVERNSHVIGDFTWTGYDYLGEAGIGCYHYAPERKEQGWFPDRLAYCGDINLNGDRRPVSYLREVAYGLRREPTLAVERLDRYGQADNTNDWKYADALDSWTWPGFEGKPAVVHVFSPDEEVELFLNGASLGRKPAGEAVRFDVTYEVTYAPGTLEAVSYAAGRETGRFALVTAGEPVALTATPSKTTLTADGQSLALIPVELRDADGRWNRRAQKAVTVTVEGPAVLAGFGSAAPQTEGSYQSPTQLTYDGQVMAAVRTTDQPGEITLRFTAEGCGETVVKLTSV